jgi:hypothetical protein
MEFRVPSLGDRGKDLFVENISVPREPADQGQFGECVAYAMLKVIEEQLMFKYGIAIDFEKHIEQMVTWMGAEEGTWPDAAASKFNQELREVKNLAKTQRLGIKITATKFTDFDQFTRLVDASRGDYNMVVIVRTKVGGHGLHALAAKSMLPGSADVVRCMNSWGDTQPVYKATRENMDSFFVINTMIERVRVSRRGGLVDSRVPQELANTTQHLLDSLDEEKKEAEKGEYSFIPFH